MELGFFAIRTKLKVNNHSGGSQEDSGIVSVETSLYLNYLFCPGEQRKEKHKTTIFFPIIYEKEICYFSLICLVSVVTVPSLVSLAVVFLCDLHISFWSATRVINLLSYEGKSFLSNLRSAFKCSLSNIM